MATWGAHSMLLSHGEGTPNLCIKTGLSVRGDLRFHRTRGFTYAPSMVVLKVMSTARNPTRLRLLRPYRHSCSLGWQHNQGKGYSSPITTKMPRERIFKVTVDRMLDFLKDWSNLRITAVAGILISVLMIIPSADAVDALKTCACLLKDCRPPIWYSYGLCRVELAKCLSNPSCAANIACLQTCNNRPDETECQIKCGDLFENSVVDEFNECAVSRKKCVPKKSDVGEFPAPNPAVLVNSFNIADFSGKWFITSGLNPTFDTFDCQLHEFHIESNKLVGNLSWRIRTPDAGFLTRSAVQTFVQDPSYPGILYNHDNEYLHYQDDWYILSSKIENKPDDYVFVYYRGRNDAWDGYGGAVVYTRSAVLPESIVPELEKAAKSVGRDFSKFIRTDNTCGPEPSLVERLEKKVEEGEETIVREVEQLEEEVEKVGKTELSLFEKLVEGFKVFQEDEENFLRGLSKEEMEILNGLQMEASEVGSSLDVPCLLGN
ncbi:hypothetical protein Fmac_007142 [Flemingia macrophylla]|uniref:VDE lipocalin domain-containing protein n=1 Tax=Flemingia macrophylla TaxID=520843 RepID=A0ABD1NDU2_9FABA